MLIQKTLTCVTTEHEKSLKKLLSEAIYLGCKPDIVNMIDDLWYKSYAMHETSQTNHKKILELYSLFSEDIHLDKKDTLEMQTQLG